MGIGQEFGQRGEVALHDRQQIGVQHDRAGALVFAEFGEDIGRDADRDAGQFGRKNRAGTPLMLGIGVGMQEADCDGLDMIPAELLGHPAEPGFVRVGGDPDHELVAEILGQLAF